MSREARLIVGVGVGLAGTMLTVGVALAGLIVTSQNSAAEDRRAIRTEFQIEIREIRTEIRKLRTEFQIEIREIRAEFREDLRSIRSSLDLVPEPDAP